MSKLKDRLNLKLKDCEVTSVELTEENLQESKTNPEKYSSDEELQKRLTKDRPHKAIGIFFDQQLKRWFLHTYHFNANDTSIEANATITDVGSLKGDAILAFKKAAVDNDFV